MSELKELGLTGAEATVYKELLQLGASKAGSIIKKTQLHRATVYDVLRRLIEQGLVSTITRRGVTSYEAADPEKLLELIREEKARLETKEVKAQKLIGELRALKKGTPVQEAHIFLGKSGVRTVLEEILRVGVPFFSFGAEGRFKEYFGSYFANWNLRRRTKKIPYKIIYSKFLRGKRPAPEMKLVKARFISPIAESPATTIIFGDQVVIIVWNDEPLAILIRNKAIAQSYQSQFDVLWKNAKP